ncbi:Histone methylation DOT1 domain and Histone H3-K79 methyltransferase family-containing protein [Strongyloides ratti]|uniref:Histone-lysine N-methyltransferase, H3 lysine-79 specific n=1 Tax=Strongyloides ratti TaxID=34506 RepID=A0A090LHN6_STRRB|nr:Histone methylation DOT1 domain and Histone H3-K79 methyltransferase family-containing protein [Strongyloides ratti]CEF67663.1 Histone methylation DOT1 domain and Histone H3-K79 methyltransferase family-containing protein [Strongyloides ratti]
MISPTNFSSQKIILLLRDLDVYSVPFKMEVICVEDLPEEIGVASELGFQKVLVKPFYFMVIARCSQAMALENCPKFGSFCSDTLEDYNEDIEKYTQMIFNDLKRSDVVDEVIRFLVSIIRYRDEVRNYFASEYKNIFPKPSDAPKLKTMTEVQSTLLFNRIKECFAKKKILQRYYNAGTEYVYGELNPHAFFQVDSEERSCYEGDNFFDCGAGIFNMVAIASATKFVHRSIGIEINPGVACPGALLLLGFYHVARFANYHFNSSTHIIGNFNNPVLEKLLFSRPSTIIVNNFVLSPATMDPFFEKLAKNHKNSIKFVLTKEPSFCRKLPFQDDDKREKLTDDRKRVKGDILTNNGFIKKELSHIQRAGSWTDNTVKLYFYYR